MAHWATAHWGAPLAVVVQRLAVGAERVVDLAALQPVAICAVQAELGRSRLGLERAKFASYFTVNSVNND